MATRQINAVSYASTVAEFKDWAQEIGIALAAFGWVQTADTGQVNWSTIAAVPDGTPSEYEIWRMGDALQSTSPFFMKVEFYATTNAPVVAVTVGTGSDGAGTLTGAGDRKVMTGNATSAVTEWECDFSGNTSSFRMRLFRDNTTASGCMLFSVERSVDSTGANTDEFAFVVWASQSLASCYNQVIPKIATFGNVTTEANFLCALPRATTSCIYENNLGVSAVFPWFGKLHNPSPNFAVGATGDFVDGTLVSVTLYGVAKTMMVLNRDSGSQAAMNGKTTCVLMRYE